MLNKDDVFVFLDELRESGVTNMYGAVPYIIYKFNVNNATAAAYLLEWMDTLAERRNNDN